MSIREKSGKAERPVAIDSGNRSTRRDDGNAVCAAVGLENTPNTPNPGQRRREDGEVQKQGGANCGEKSVSVPDREHQGVTGSEELPANEIPSVVPEAAQDVTRPQPTSTNKPGLNLGKRRRRIEKSGRNTGFY